jgi:mRNA-degrading endonuclease RelE of RelBE toxin-antitoxin system
VERPDWVGPSVCYLIEVYRLLFAPSADEDLAWFRKPEQRLIVEGAIEQLTHEPTNVTQNRKPMRPNPIATWCIRLREYRVYYDVDTEANLVTIRAVGYKDHNVLLIRGSEVQI